MRAIMLCAGILVLALLPACSCGDPPLGSIDLDGLEELDFGEVAVGARRARPFTLRNRGASAVTVSLSLTGTPAFDLSVSSIEVPPAGASQVELGFSPPEVGPLTGTLVLTTTGDEPRTVLLRGRGIEAQSCGGGAACDDPPPDTCLDEHTLRAYADPGLCDGELFVCLYASTDVPCEEGETCSEGACGSSFQCPPDTGVVRVSTAAGGAFSPAALHDGTGLLVSWQFDEDGNPGGPYDFHLGRLNDSGQVTSLSSATTTGSVAHRPRMAFDGARVAFAWSDVRDGDNDILFAFLEGDALGTPTKVTDHDAVAFLSDLAFNPTGSEWGVVWMDDRARVGTTTQVYFARVDAAGAFLGESAVTGPEGHVEYPRVAWADGAWGVTWFGDPAGNFEIYFLTLAADGTPRGAPTRLTDDPAASLDPDLAWNGAEYALVWQDLASGDGDLWFARVAADGSMASAPAVLVGGPSTSSWPDLVWSGTDYGLAWSDDRDGRPGVYFARVDTSGAFLEAPRRVACSEVAAVQPALVWDGAAFHVFWADHAGGTSTVNYRRID